MKPRAARDAAGLVAFLAIVYAVSFLGSLFTSSSVGTWYVALAKPPWTPPGAVIGGVWGVLFALIGIAGWLVWREGGFRAQRAPLTIFGVQLVLNVAWSAIFFGARAPGWALVEIVLLALAILATIFAFWRVKPLAGALLIPYIAWVSFAGWLNFTIWRLNA